MVILLQGCQRDEPAVTGELAEPEVAAERSTAWIDHERLANADAEPGNWLAHGRTWSEQRFSPLNQVNDSNVSELGLAWHFDLDTARGQQATPIVVDGVMYTTSAWSKVQVLDAKTGELKWQFDPEVPKEWDAKACCGVQNRGVAVWKGRVYVGTLDGRLIALNAETGDVEWEVQTTDRNQSYSITGAPRVVKDKVVIGNGGAEYGVRGYVTAYDAETGEQAWRFYTVPGNPADGFENETMEMAAGTWTGEWWSQGGGGTAWDSMAYDPDLNLLYIGTGNGSPWPRALRSPDGGDNLFLCSIVAINADTGEYAWHYQTVPGDTWDYTSVQHMILADMEIDGRERQVIMQAPKNGFFYVIDRATGELISAENFAPANWATHIDLETGRPVETPGARYDETLTAMKIVPGPSGAHNWMPMSYNPDTGLVYLPARQISSNYRLDQNFQARPVGFNTGLNGWDDFDEINELPPEFGPDRRERLLAWDPVRQEEVWRVELNKVNNGGVLSTAGNLVFQGNTDEVIAAYNAETGERLWMADTQTAITAPPMTYSVDGEQYVAVVAGWGAVNALIGGADLNGDGSMRNFSRVLAFKLGGAHELPPRPALPERPTPPENFGDQSQVDAGDLLYRRNCVICHGVQAIGGGVLPDLRYTPMIQSTESFRSVLIDGALADRGMVSFAEILSAEDAESIRAYLVDRAHESITE
jgi:PQQ-dependent dehydrogenase (methanol/ethanol family)